MRHDDTVISGLYLHIKQIRDRIINVTITIVIIDVNMIEFNFIK
jgi:hypothetical protein